MSTEMKSIVVTGASGDIGLAIIGSLSRTDFALPPVAAITLTG